MIYINIWPMDRHIYNNCNTVSPHSRTVLEADVLSVEIPHCVQMNICCGQSMRRREMKCQIFFYKNDPVGPGCEHSGA